MSVYAAIDLKSFYASVECRERGLDPLSANLVVADISRTEKTICLAVSPALKAFGIPGRPRLFEVIQQVRDINRDRRRHASGRRLYAKSFDSEELAADPSLELDYIIATPRMALYIDYSRRIFEEYLKYVSPDDIHVYSIDEVFIDLSGYLNIRKMTPREFVAMLIRDVYEQTGITATAGIGSNLYLAKVAMDIVAKHSPPDEFGVRIAELDEKAYREALWTHTPITDFWRIGPGYARRLAEHGMMTMGDVARCSVGKPWQKHNEDMLYRLFGVNAELLIDHAWGREPCTIAEIKAYRPQSTSMGSGQVLPTPYPADKARIVVREMAEQLAMDLFAKGLASGQVVLTLGYDRANLEEGDVARSYTGEVTEDRYGRNVPKHAHGTVNLSRPTSSAGEIAKAALSLFDRIIDSNLLVRRINISAENTHIDAMPESAGVEPEQLNLFADPEVSQAARDAAADALSQEKRRQRAVLSARKRFGKNAVLKASSLQDGARAKSRNEQIGGHKA